MPENESPFDQFRVWFSQASVQETLDPFAMTLATVDKDYSVTARIVLLKDFSEKGLVFFTNYNSPKAKALNAIPQAALVFWWPTAQRQVRITGKVAKTSSEVSDHYFQSRSFESQISAIVSKQSQVLVNRDTLIKEYDLVSPPLSRPDYWGGYILTPDRFEFWQGRPHRLHDRFEYLKKNEKWEVNQLYP